MKSEMEIVKVTSKKFTRSMLITYRKNNLINNTRIKSKDKSKR